MKNSNTKELVELSIESTHFEVEDILNIFLKAIKTPKEEAQDWFSRLELQLNRIHRLQKGVERLCVTIDNFWCRLLQKFIEASAKFKKMFNTISSDVQVSSSYFFVRLNRMDQKAKIALLYRKV